MKSKNPSEFNWVPLLGTDAMVLERGVFTDERGVFHKPFISSELDSIAPFSKLNEVNISHSTKVGTVRGFHMQAAPNAETKIVTCIAGSILDAIIDCREESDTYGQVITVLLEENDGNSVFVPKGFAHGFQTLQANTSILYCVDEKYNPNVQLGINPRSDELIELWPLPVENISSQDKNLPSWNSFMKIKAKIN